MCIEGGHLSSTPVHPELQAGVALEERLHAEIRTFARPDTTFGELFDFAEALIESRGFENLDLRRNLGHSIVRRLEDRSFIEAGNARRLGDAQLFTFEPHVRAIGGRWGFKHEEIHCFDDSGNLIPL